MANEKLIETLAKQSVQSYTPRELELISLGVRIGAQNAKEINRKPDEWYEEREAKKPTPEEVDATTEWLKRESGLGKAVENLKKMKSYDEVETEVLERLFKALANNPEEAQRVIDLLRVSVKQYYTLHPKEEKQAELSREQIIARKLYAESVHLQQSELLRKTTKNALRLLNIDTLADLVGYTKEDLIRTPRFGGRSITNIDEYLRASPGGYQFYLGMDLSKS